VKSIQKHGKNSLLNCGYKTQSKKSIFNFWQICLTFTKMEKPDRRVLKLFSLKRLRHHHRNCKKEMSNNLLVWCINKLANNWSIFHIDRNLVRSVKKSILLKSCRELNSHHFGPFPYEKKWRMPNFLFHLMISYSEISWESICGNHENQYERKQVLLLHLSRNMTYLLQRNKKLYENNHLKMKI
jgi:hypothetical protein